MDKDGWENPKRDCRSQESLVAIAAKCLSVCSFFSQAIWYYRELLCSRKKPSQTTEDFPLLYIMMIALDSFICRSSHPPSFHWWQPLPVWDGRWPGLPSVSCGWCVPRLPGCQLTAAQWADWVAVSRPPHLPGRPECALCTDGQWTTVSLVTFEQVPWTWAEAVLEHGLVIILCPTILIFFSVKCLPLLMARGWSDVACGTMHVTGSPSVSVASTTCPPSMSCMLC